MTNILLTVYQEDWSKGEKSILEKGSLLEKKLLLNYGSFPTFRVLSKKFSAKAKVIAYFLRFLS